MAWESRGGRKYLYRSVRCADGRVRKEYLGRGAAAIEAERKRAESRAAREAEATEALELAAALGPLDGLAEELDEGVDEIIKAVLEQKGFRCHRGTWRRQRGNSNRGA